MLRAELKKILFTQKTVWVLLLCLVLKIVFLSVFPEQKDERIVLSQKQYDKYLAQLYGEATAEKNEWIITEYETCKETLSRQEEMEGLYRSGELTDVEYRAYIEELSAANLHLNSAELFSEKAEQFQALSPDLPTPHYLYEYGWKTVFWLLKFPDVFVLIPLLLLGAQCFSFESASGMLPVLLSAKHGRGRLYLTKLLALLLVALVSLPLFPLAEWAVFAARGWLNDASAPIQSVGIVKNCALSLSLRQGYLLTLLLRSAAAIFLCLFVFACSIRLQNAGKLLFFGLVLLSVPLLFATSLLLFTHSGLLCGTKTLLWLKSLPQAAMSISIVCAYTALALLLAGRRYRKGER